MSDATPTREQLTAACRGDGLTSLFQPIVDVERGTVAGYESLIRFGCGPANPERWFATARQQGCEAELEAAALRSALGYLGELPPNCFLTVNVSPTALASDAVRAVWGEQSDLDGLVVELTEQTPIESYGHLEPDLNRLRSAGVLIAVDDAGAGYAGLRHLINLRPSIIKLDRALISDIDTDETKRALADMLGTFASRIDAWLLGEGVERTGELDVLASLGVPLTQGFLLGRPGPPWMPIDPDAALRLVSRSRVGDDYTLERHLAQAPTTHDIHAAPLLLAQPGVDVVVLLDRYDRPVAALDSDLASLGLVRPGMRANVATPISEAASRAVTRDQAERFSPVLCTDNAGRYVGIVAMERIITALADAS